MVQVSNKINHINVKRRGSYSVTVLFYHVTPA